MLKINKHSYYKILSCLLKNNISEFCKNFPDDNIKMKIDICNKKVSKNVLQDTVYLLSLAKYYIKENKYDQAIGILKNLQIKKMTLIQKACFKFLMALTCLYNSFTLTLCPLKIY